jgi:hypothetical protein
MGTIYILKKMSPKTFLKKWSTGSSNVRIQKANTSKRSFISSLQADNAFMSKVGAVQDEYKISGDSFGNHPKKSEINQRLTALIKSRSGNQVKVSGGTKYPEAPMKSMSNTGSARITPAERAAAKSGRTPDVVWDETGVRMADDRTEWIHTAVAYEIDRFREHGALTQPPKFSRWDKDPKRAAVQKKLVDNLEKMGREGKLSRLEVSGGKGGGEALPAIELVGVIANAAAVQMGIETEAERKRVEAARQESSATAAIFDQAVAGIDKSTMTEAKGGADKPAEPSSAESKRPPPSGSASIRELGRDFFASNVDESQVQSRMAKYNNDINNQYSELVSEGHPEGDTTWANAINRANKLTRDEFERAKPPVQTLFPPPKVGIAPEPSFDTGLKTILPTPTIGDVRKSLEISKGLATRARTAVGQGDPDRPRRSTDTGDPDRDPLGGKTETDAPPPPPPPPGTETDEDARRRRTDDDERKKPPRGPFIRRPIPRDDDDDGRDKSTQVNIPKTPKISNKRPELRPFFQIGGEDSLRISPEEKAREARDWEAFNYVPGESYQSYDNPMTRFEKQQYDYRFYRTYPDARMVTPTPFDGRAPRTMMRDIYESTRGVPRFYDPYDNGQYVGRSITNLQNTHHASTILNRATQLQHYPDTSQIAQKNYMAGVRNATVAILLGSKTLF